MINFVELSDSLFHKFIVLVHLHTGITIAPSKKNMIEGRVRKRLKALKLENYEDYVDFLKENEVEKQEFINIVTTNETSFFRTAKVWDYFQDEFLKNWDRSKKLKVWSSASSTGEEAYSIAMSCEGLIRDKGHFDYEIIGTDISTRALSIANKGIYSGRNYKNLCQKFPQLSDRFFINIEDESGQVIDELKRRTSFLSHNLFNTPATPLKQFDIVFLRNVLIYFTKEDQKKVIENILVSMKKNSVLILGESESINGLSNEFEYLLPQIYMKK